MNDYDIAIVGYGPVGQVAAALLGASGHRVAVVERHPGLYGLPRAGHVDHEIMRIFQSIGSADEMAERAWPMTAYDVYDAGGRILQELDWNHDGISGWHSDFLIYQVYLEESLDAAVRRANTVDVRFGKEAIEIVQDADGVTLTVRDRGGSETEEIRARFLIGADGANSFVRSAAGIEMTDFGFEADWLVMDVRPHQRDAAIVDRKWGTEMPGAGQICDPVRPISLFRWLGLEHCRWEFMLLDGESPADMEDA
jgi:2-polyprenyl-6-methoxyphenol hydroxylase-like FAD-dependent oxidoreductase